MLHPSTFGYLQPTNEQAQLMMRVRQAFKNCGDEVERLLPDGADKTYVLRKLRECGMWANVAVTRQADGTPRTEPEVGTLGAPAPRE